MAQEHLRHECPARDLSNDGALTKCDCQCQCTAVTIRAGGTSQPAAFAHNSFAFSDASLGGSQGMTGEAIATMSDGTTRAVPFRVGSLDNTTPGLS